MRETCCAFLKLFERVLIRLHFMRLLTKAQTQQELDLKEPATSPSEEQKQASPPPQGTAAPRVESLPRQPLAMSKNLSQDYGGQFLSSTTRHNFRLASWLAHIPNIDINIAW
ncbi:hypothetical protein KSP40_PGU015973 [Platanthera guangdongensis]|uniref:Uncharacterized protein n=1 Tax=Platanthera guangdongensis TaxID=2320717 RepID=A0ABR2N0A7_9ASPA